MVLKIKEIKLIKEITEKAEFIFSDDLGIRCCLYADKHTSETDRAIALACKLSFAGIKKLESKKVIPSDSIYVDDECLHITIKKEVFESVASKFDISRIDE